MMNKVKLKKYDRIWSKDEIKYLVNNWNKKTPKEIADKLNRSLVAVHSKYERIMRFTNGKIKWGRLISGVEVRKKLEKEGRKFSPDEELFACPICEKLYKTMTTLKKHFVDVHYINRTCPLCNAKYDKLILHFAKQGYDSKNDEIIDLEYLVLFGLSLRRYTTTNDNFRKLALDLAYNFCSIWGDNGGREDKDEEGCRG